MKSKLQNRSFSFSIYISFILFLFIYSCQRVKENSFPIIKSDFIQNKQLIAADSLAQINLTEVALSIFLTIDTNTLKPIEKLFYQMRFNELIRIKHITINDQFNYIKSSSAAYEQPIQKVISTLSWFYETDILNTNEKNLLVSNLKDIPKELRWKTCMALGRYYHLDSFQLDSTSKYYNLAFNEMQTQKYYGLDYYWTIRELAEISKYSRHNKLGIAYSSMMTEKGNFNFNYDKLNLGIGLAIKGYLLFRIQKEENAYELCSKAKNEMKEFKHSKSYQMTLRNQLQIISFSNGKLDNQFEKVASEYRKNVFEIGDYFNMNRSLGTFYSETNQCEKALAHLRKALEYENKQSKRDVPVTSTILTIININLQKIGNYDDAIGVMVMDATKNYLASPDSISLRSLLKKEFIEKDYSYIELYPIAQALYKKYQNNKTTNNLEMAELIALAADSISTNQLNSLSEDALQELFIHRKKISNLLIKILIEKYSLDNDKNYLKKIFEVIEKEGNSTVNSEILQYKFIPINITKRLKQLRTVAKSMDIDDNIDKLTSEQIIELSELERIELEKLIHLKHKLYEIAIDLDSLQFILADSQQILHYYKLDTTFIIMSITNSDVSLETNLINSEIDSLISKYSTFTLKDTRVNCHQYCKETHEIFEYLRLNLVSKKNLTIIRNGVAPFLNFEILCADTTVRNVYSELPYLLYRHTISYIPSVQLLDFSLYKNQTRQSLIALSFSSRANEQNILPALYGGIKEVEMLIESKNAEAFFGADADKERFLNEYQNKNNSHLHISTHGSSNPDERENIKLYFQNSAGKLDTLFAYELLAVDSEIKTVVLSACYTASGNNHTEMGNYNFARYFRINGAKNIASSTWELSDYSSSKLFEKFYKYFPQNSFSESMRKAKLELIDENPEISHPYFWGGIVVN